MFKSRILAIALIFTFTFGQVSAFEITVKSKYDDALNYLEEVNLIKDQASFQPKNLINKAEFVTLMLKNAGYNADEMKRKTFRTPFKDVPQNAWYAPYVYIAYENGLIPQTEYFQPEKTMTRFEVLTFFFTLEGIATPLYNQTTAKFRDVSAKSKMSAVVAKTLELGLMTPEEKDFFGVLQKVQKGEVAVLIYEYALYQDYSSGNQDDVFSEEIPNADILLDVWNRIHSDYFFEDKIDDDKMIYAAIEAMVGALEDPFTVYMPPEEGSDYNDSLEGELEGIGAYIGLEEGKIIIISPIQGSPAFEAGLKPNDEIIKVDGEDVVGKPVYEIVNKIKGPKDTKVKITILRNNQEKVFVITRAKIDLKSVTLEMKDGIAVITLNQFISKTAQEFEVVAQELLEQKAQGIVLDLRNNPGGFLNVSIDILGYFVKKGEKILAINYPKIILEQDSKGKAELGGLPLVVLINEGSASASEIVAGALQDLKLAKIIGQTSYGKGTVQELTYYIDDSNLKLTVAKWLTPKGKWIDGVGIVPDIEVENIEGNDTDYQMQRALQEVGK